MEKTDLARYKETVAPTPDVHTAIERFQRGKTWGGPHPHAWRGSWRRPLEIDERREHPFTIARMTDHNVRGLD